MKYLNYLVLGVLFLLSGCTESEDVIQIEHPEKVAVAFFEALYNEKNIEKAASACSPALSRIIRHYRSPQAVARHIFNMSYDQVEIKPDDSGVKVREQFKNKAVITIYFDGYYQENRFKDVKRLSLIQQDNKWLIDKILKDPF
ncbi:hypothetical protein SG34_018770 [Thalassomonas viridans]|uniref:Lipoprotein n=1 Tax=Thalassomonas viridans TaxID=137584 RepID=A0AAE9Z1D8_9GAMM|nr:lipoprotein [Thalassomonas viridans]WDE03428.1 hypothetical protein SG34_018770 [Thalassomonas viridans]